MSQSMRAKPAELSADSATGHDQPPAIGTETHPNGSLTKYAWMAEDSTFVLSGSVSSETQLDFHFVAETGTGRPGGPVRNLIRSHARRSGHSRVVPILETASEHRKRKQSSRTRKKPVSRELSHLLNPSRGPGKNALDPFKLLPAGNPDKAQGLLNHYESVFRHSYCPVEPREQWVSFAISDPALLHATLGSSALSLSFLKGKLSSPDVEFYQTQTIQIIKRRLTNEPNQMVSDTSICAVACLTQFENLLANPAGIKIHMDGLESMVKSRGGIQALASSKLTLSLTSWIDSAASIVLETKPRFERDEQAVEVAADWNQHPLLAIRYRSKLFNLSGLRYLSDETVGVYHRLCYLSGLKEAASCHLDLKVEMSSYSDMLEILERRVVRIVQSDELRATTSSNCAVFSIFGNAVLLHIYMFMRDIPRGLPFLQLLSTRIRNLLEKEDVQRLELQYPEMMLWIFIMGGMGGIGTPNRGWFAKHLAEACLSLGILGGNEIAFTLSEFLWSELYLSPVTMGFWNDVARAQGAEKAYEVRRLTDDVSVAPFNAPPDLE